MKKTTVLNLKQSTLLKFLGCGLLAFLAADVQAQLLYKTKFSAVEGYTNGWCIGQPSLGNKWLNANYDLDWVRANGDPGSYSPINNGAGSTNEDGSIFYNVTATNCTAPGGGQMMVAADNNQNDGLQPEDFPNRGTYFFKMDFPTQRKGPVTVTWDWSYHNTNEIPADFDPTNNSYNAALPGFDHGFTFSDWANRTADSADGNPNWKYSELGTPCRLSTYQDCRYNAIGGCGGGGNWNDYGPVFKDGKTLHMKLIVNVTNAPAEYMNTYEVFAQRDGEQMWQTAFREDTYIAEWIKDGVATDKYVAASGFRRCPGETDPTSGVDCLMLWLNGQVKPKYALVSNIRVVGPDPVPVPTLSIAKVAGNVQVTFTGWLEAADDPQGPFTTVAVTTYPYTTPTVYTPPTGTKKYYRASN
ncbi:MAG: hypothetical protein IT579_15070 [Verrucomicrobia subdivision 3 bacterium]|nr:hypothetical protein [Verrucomicrobiota bacterium]MCC6822051.1 hypothetical protein [Limisphaerales bacterium]